MEVKSSTLAELFRTGPAQPEICRGGRQQISRPGLLDRLARFINQVAPPLQITEAIPAKALRKAGSQWVFDFGVNYAGWFTFTMNGTGRAGTRIVFYPAENVTVAGGPDQASSGSPIFDAYTIAGLESESYTPKFMYHGNQYVAVGTLFAHLLIRLCEC